MSEGVHDDIWARVMAVEKNGRTVLVLTADLIGLFLPDVEEIRTALESKSLLRDYIIVTTTHNHSGPDVVGLWNIDRGKSGLDFGYLK